MAAGTAGGLLAGEPARTHAFAALRQAILSGDFAPGQRLVEEELAGTLGVTRQSLRAALLDLTAEGLVERFPNRGARVRVVSTEEAVAITECRMALEALCAVKAAERVTDEEGSQLRALGEQLTRSVADGDPLRYSELNRELHRRIGVISGQRVAVGLLDRLHAQLVRHQFQLALRPGRPEVSLAEHLAIAHAVADRRPEDADRAVRAHLASVIVALREADDGSSAGANHEISGMPDSVFESGIPEAAGETAGGKNIGKEPGTAGRSGRERQREAAGTAGAGSRKQPEAAAGSSSTK